MKAASITEVGSEFSAILKSTEGGPVVVTRKGRPVAVIVGVSNEEETERLLMAHSAQLRSILERSRRQYREGRWLGEEEFWSAVARNRSSKAPNKAKRKKA